MRVEVEQVQGLITELKMSMEQIFADFDSASLARIVQTVLQSSGVLFLTGVGKSGSIAQKIAATVTSTGTKAIYLSPLDALHGDIGMIGPNDILIMFSKSGETDELFNLVPAVRQKGAYLIVVVSNPKSRLIQAADDAFILASVRELCPYDLVPTTSTLAQLVFGDILAAVLMRRRNVSLSDFITNHPAGRIGKRQIVCVSDLMLTGDRLPKCSPNDTLGEILVELSNKQCGAICVVDTKDSLLGIFTDGDLRRTLQKYGNQALEQPLNVLMTKNPKTASPDMLAFEAMKRMEEGSPITVLVVVDNNRCVGLIKMHDIIQAGL